MPGDDHVALLAEHDGLVVGVASYEVLSGDRAEMAILVDDAWQGDGIGSLLIEHLTAVARRDGIQELVGDVLATNVSMLRTSASLAPGIARQHGEDPGVVRIQIPTQPDERALAAAGARDRTAEHNSLRPLLAPASLAVIGVSRSQSGVGYEVLRAVLAGGFTGRTYPVNPHAKTIDGLECYPSVGAIPERWTWPSLPCRLRAFRGSSRNAGLHTWVRPLCSAPGSARPDHLVRRPNHGCWPQLADTTSESLGRTALG